MSGANALQDSNSKVIETAFQPAFIVGTSEKKDSLRILHVDDERCFLEVSKQILSLENNFEVDTALPVDEAFQKMERQPYDAIVSDYEMPLKSGLDFLRELRKQKNEIPFILFTGKGREDVAVKALNLGADSYLNKNGSPETVYCELAHAINKTVEQRKSRKLLAASESKYRTLVEKSLQGIMVTLADSLRLLFANDTMGKILGYSSQELTSLSPEGVMGLVYREDRAVFFGRMENRFRGELATSSLEFRAVRKDGSIIWLSALSNRVEYDGQPAVQGMFLDINERKKAEETLLESEERFSKAFHSSPVPQIITRFGDWRYVDANESVLHLLGYEREELIGHTSAELNIIALDKRDRGVSIVREQGGLRNFETDVLTKSGRIITVLTSSETIIINGQKHLISTFLDITERKKTRRN